MGSGTPWTTPSELAEHEFCPRALHYHRTREAPTSRSAVAGTTFHRRQLGAERWRSDHPGWGWVALAAGVTLVGVGLAILAR